MKPNLSKKGDTQKHEPPDIFEAARNDDMFELRRALEEGQSLGTSQIITHLTPMHVAAMRGSAAFLKVALEIDPRVAWMQDAQLRIPFDHASARQDRRSMALLHNAMYPEALINVPESQF